MLSDKYDRKAVLFLFFLLFLGSCLVGCSFMSFMEPARSTPAMADEPVPPSDPVRGGRPRCQILLFARTG